MRAVNLIPPEDRRGDRAPLRAGPLAYVLVSALLLLFVGVYLLVSTGNSITEREAQVAALEQDLEASSARVAALQSFTSFASLEEQRTATVDSLARSRFDWERVLRELAYVIPADVTLDSLAGGVSGAAQAGGGGTAPADVTAPSLTMTGCAPTHGAVARMVAALRDIDGVTRVGLSSSTDQSKGDSGLDTSLGSGSGAEGECGTVSFSVTIAFDEVPVDGSGAIAQPPPAAPVDDGGVAEAEDERKSGKDAVDQANQQSNEAIDQYVPGA